MNSYYRAIAAILLTTKAAVSVSDPATTHPENATYRYIYAGYNEGAYDAYFWWEGGNLWMEAIPRGVTTIKCYPDDCSFFQGDLITRRGQSGWYELFIGDQRHYSIKINQPTVFKLRAESGKSLYPNLDVELRNPTFGSIYEFQAVQIPKWSTYGIDPSITPEKFYKIKLYVSGSGVIKKSVPGRFIPEGGRLLLQAKPSAGWTFSGWRGACTGMKLCNPSFAKNQVVRAIFKPSLPPSPPTPGPICPEPLIRLGLCRN